MFRLHYTLVCTAFLLLTLQIFAQAPAPLGSAPAVPVSAETKAAVQRIIGDTLVNGQAYEYDRQLSDEIGPRLTGSPTYLQAVKWGETKFKELGLTNVHTETFRSDTWEPVPGTMGEITSPIRHTLHLWSYGYSPSTPKDGIAGEVVYLPSLAPEDIEAMRSKAAGRIVFFDRTSYPKEFNESVYGKAMAAIDKLHPSAVLVTGGKLGTESQGNLSFDGTLSPYPVAQIGMEDELLLKRLLEKGTVRIRFQFSNRTAKGVGVPEVMGEIRGSEKPDEVVIVGAHLDSWSPGTGAQDNGTGAATVVDAAREIMSLGRSPKRTMRFILFGGEEQGLFGSAEYARKHAADASKLDAVLITDTGAATPHGWYVMGRTDEKAALANVQPLLSGLGSDGLSEDPRFLFSSDHAAFNVQGVPTLLLWTESYETLHHKASDTFDSVNRATLLQGDATVVATAYAIADSASSFAPHIQQPQVEQMIKDAKHWDDYQALKAAGLLP